MRVNKRFALFGYWVSSVYWLFIGFFLFCFAIFLSLSLIFSETIYCQWALFMFLGVINYTMSFVLFRRKYGEYLRIPSYKTYLFTKHKLWIWSLYSSVIYLLSASILMIVLGSMGGFGLYFASTQQLMFIKSDGGDLMRNSGIILFLAIWSLIISCWLVYERGRYWFNKCHQNFLRQKKTVTSFLKW